MLNKIILMGRFTKDPELRHTQSGVSVASFTLAVDRDFKAPNGQRETDFIDITAWRGTADFVSKYFSKGRMAAVEGRLQIEEWTDNDGNKRRNAKVVADHVYFGDFKRDSDGTQTPYYGAPKPAGAPVDVNADNSFDEIGEEDGELPFNRGL